MVLRLDSLSLQGTNHHWQELRLFRSSDLSLSECSRTTERARRPSEKIGYEQFGTQWEQEFDSQTAWEGQDGFRRVCGTAGIICVCIALRLRLTVVQKSERPARIARRMFPLLTFCRVNCLAALSKCSNLRRLDLSFVSESISMIDLLRSVSLLSKLECLRLRTYFLEHNFPLLDQTLGTEIWFTTLNAQDMFQDS